MTRQDELDNIERKVLEIAGDSWTGRTVPRDHPLSEQIELFVQNPHLRGPGRALEDFEPTMLFDLAQSAKQIESQSDDSARQDWD